MFKNALLIALIPFILTACANQQLSNSGHISNIDKLEAVETTKIEKHKKIETFVIADAPSRSFSHLAINPIKFDLPAKSAAKLTVKNKEKLSKYFDKSIQKQLENYPILDTHEDIPAKTYLVDMIVTDINHSNAPLNFILTATVALPFDTGGITAETRIVDLDTNEEVAAFRGYREGTMFHIIGGMTKYGHAQGGLDLYTKEIKELLENFICVNCTTAQN